MPCRSLFDARLQGWEAKVDRTNNRIFYVDHNTKSTSWERPPPLTLTPPGQIIPAGVSQRPTPATAGWGAAGGSSSSMTPMTAGGLHHRYEV